MPKLPGRKLRLRCRLMVQTMPMGNSMPIFNPLAKIAAQPAHAPEETTAAAVVDAHTLPDIQIESVIQQITSAMPMVLTEKEMAIRKQIASKLLITMGSKILHFENNINPDGTIDVDWTFAPMPGCEDDLSDDTRIKSHAVLRIYSEHTMVPPTPDAPIIQTGGGMVQYYHTPDSKFCYLTGCTAIDLAALMQHSIDVTTGKVDHATQREYDFAVQTNFCTTFNVCTVLPLTCIKDPKEILEMQQDLDLFRGGIAAYEREASLAKKEKREAVHVDHDFMSSILR